MDTAHLHLLLNHVPVLGAFFAIPLLLVALRRGPRDGALLGAVLLLLATGAGATGSFLTGEPAEDAVEGLPGVTEARIEAHEERAELATPLALGTALLGVGVLLRHRLREAPSRAPTLALLGATTVTAAAMAWTGLAGGAIRHTELGTPPAVVASLEAR